MTRFFYYMALVNAFVAFLAGAAAYFRNRYHPFGTIFGLAMTAVALWLSCFAQYYRPMPEADALWWAKATLTIGAISTPLLFHSMCAFVNRTRQCRWWLAVSYLLTVGAIVLVWSGRIVMGLKEVPYMEHYIRYNRSWYPALSFQLVFWQFAGVGVMALEARRAVGYQRTQLIYFLTAWLIVFLTTNSIIIPLEYDLNIMPFGYFVLPLNFGLLAYALAKARLADFNVVIARVLLHMLTLLVVAGANLLFLGALTLAAPDFMTAEQISVVVVLVLLNGLVLSIWLPRWLPRAERLMQERFFGSRLAYQEAIADLVNQLGRLPNVDEALATACATLHSQMQVTRVFILLQDPLSGEYRLRAESGLNAKGDTDRFTIRENAAVVRWLRERRQALVRDEVARQVSPEALRSIDNELQQLGAVVCVPMQAENALTGIICLGPKISGKIFYPSDIKLLETLATELALAVKYQRIEEEISRRNKLVELGTIAAGVAHEIRNPLASIRTFAQLLPERGDDPEFKNEFGKLVIQDVDRITRVIETMLAFARPAQVTIAEHRLPELVEEAVLLVQSRIKSRQIELVRQIDRPITVRVDKQQIIQVLVNLLSNAVDAVPSPGGRIRITTGTHQLDGAPGHDGPRRYAVIEVADNGPGIPAAVRERLFNPFFTTKKDGTGLGLSISQKIARDHGGIITVSSVEGQGSSFQLNLPLP